ncbi:MAG: Fic family protein [Methyloprofundus sp.]|nr:Fic family protein [Methyloprofundus sp.]
MSYQPPYTITPKILHLIAEISENLGRLSILLEQSSNLRLRRINRIRTIQGSLAIEGNTLTEQQITAILEGKPVIAPPREIQEARNALSTYEKLNQWQASNEQHLLNAHLSLMQGLIDEAGVYRHKGVGVMQGEQVIHMAPPANRVIILMGDLLNWLETTPDHALIKSCVFHYEFEFIHPFIDGNGRMGRLWQTLILSQWNPLFIHIPVESMVYAQQEAYYQALNESTLKSDSAPFIEFMLTVILQACKSDTPQDNPQVTPQVFKLLNAIKGEMSREQLQTVLKLKDRKSFRERYLLPALTDGLIEMTLPDKPKSSLQKYFLTKRGKQLVESANT